MAETIWAVIITLNTIFSLLPGMMPTSKCYEAESSDDVLLNAVIAADLHTDAQAFRDRTNILRKAFVGISKDKTDIDAVIFAGDNTNCGDEAEYANLRRLTSVYLKAERIIPAMAITTPGITVMTLTTKRPRSCFRTTAPTAALIRTKTITALR